MGKMNEDTFAVLFEYGKRVYKGEVSLDEAAKAVNSQNPEVG